MVRLAGAARPVPVSFPGVKTSRDGFVVDVDLDRLRARVGDYFDPDVSHEEIGRRYPSVMKTTAGFNARKVRDGLLARGGPDDGGFVRFAYRRSTRAGSIGKPRVACSTARAPTTVPTCSRGTCGSQKCLAFGETR